MSSYFDKIDSELKAYILGIIVFNVKKIHDQVVIIQVSSDCSFPKCIVSELKLFATDIDRDSFVVKVDDISKQVDISNVNIADFIHKNNKDHVISFFKAYYEKYGNINCEDSVCHITAYCKDDLVAFAEYFGIPYKLGVLFNLHQLIYTSVNIVDLLGIIYKNNYEIRIKNNLYMQFMQLLNHQRPVLKYTKMTEEAVTPCKSNFSDVGYDLSIIGLEKTLNSSTSLYKTGIKLDIPLGYYVEIVPRSSLSKSGYVLANSVGIIDCSYKGELLVALCQIGTEEIKFPFRCCQLIMRRQLFPDMLEVETVGDSKRNDGGFGSTS
jgi:deoxyuridine 5'-triphosphate nucleotidohydrolase